jgi:fused-like protein
VLAECCASADPGTRKFASFAVGNAAFHSSELYAELSVCMRPLSTALALPPPSSLPPPSAQTEAEWSSADEKTRANAAGAVGNLIRNSGLLSPLMAQLNIPQLLMRIIVDTHGSELTTQVSRSSAVF